MPKTKDRSPLIDESWRRRCYVVPVDGRVKGRGFRASIAVEGLAGHRPTGTWPYTGAPGETLPYFWGDDYKAADECARRANERLKLSAWDVTVIVSSTFIAQNRGIDMTRGEVEAYRAQMKEPVPRGQRRAKRLRKGLDEKLMDAVLRPWSEARLMAGGVTRYVVTHFGRDGLRVLSFPAQGRYTFATRAEAEAAMAALLDVEHNGNDLASVYGPQAVGSFEVRTCECWPGHFDPKGIYFDNTEDA